MNSDRAAETIQFQAEIQTLLDILIHSLYSDREIFLRELISNASDALHRVKFEMLTNREVYQPEAELAIHISSDPEAHTLTIRDTGIGMTHDELVQQLGTIAHSGAAAFLRQLTESTHPVDQIGQFGVGFYSVFMVADEVRVTSRSVRPQSEAWTWIATSGDHYTLVPADKEDRGTSVQIHLKEDAHEFADLSRLQRIIHRHSEFVSFPIYAGDEEEPTNRQTAVWRQATSEVTDEAANAFYRQITLDFRDPLTRIQVHTDAPVQIHALLFVPATLDRGLLGMKQDYGLRLYSHQIRIQDHNKDLLPAYLRFLEGVVDSEDLDLNVSREMVQSSPVMRRIRKVLVNRILNTLQDMARNDVEGYEKFWDIYGPFIKEGAATEVEGREKLLPLLRFYTTRSDKVLRSLNDYIAAVPGSQKLIYYIVGDSLASLQRSPHLDYFRSQQIEVLYFTEPIDSFLPSALHEYEGFRFQNVDDAGIELPQKSDEEAEDDSESPEGWEELLDQFRTRLGDSIVDVRRSEVLVQHPARLVSPEGSIGSEMERVRRMMEEDYIAAPRILELNARHRLITNLISLMQGQGPEDMLAAAIDQIYENALLVEGLHPNPADMVDRIYQILQVATSRTRSEY